MKKLFLILAILQLTFIINCKAQNNFIETSNATINGINFFKTSIDSVLTVFGEPISREDYFFEMGDVMGEIYHYEKLSFYIKKNKIESFIIDGSHYDFTSNNININDNINSLEHIYPKSFSNRGLGEIIIQFSDVDYFISIRYNKRNIIKKIELNSY